MKIVTICLLLLISRAADAAAISIGRVEVEVPDPPGYAAVTPEMEALYKLQRQFVAPSNVEFVAYIAEIDIPAALRGQIPELDRRFSVQTAASLVDASVSKADFAEFKNIIKTNHEEILARTKAAVDEAMGKINANITEEYDVDLALSVAQHAPLPVHAETERSLAYSSYVKYDMKDETGNSVPFVALVSATYIHVRGRILFLYSIAGEADISWSRNISRQWAAAIIKANPSDFQTMVREYLPTTIASIEWDSVGAKAIAGAIFALLIGLIIWLVRRGITG